MGLYTRPSQSLRWFHFRFSDCLCTVDLLICPHCVFDPDFRSITNQSHQSMSGRIRMHN